MNWDNTSLDVLLGKTIFSVWRKEYGFGFQTDQGWFSFGLAADCCSESWLYRIKGKCEGKVLNIVEPDLSDINPDDGLCRQESDDIFGIGIKTEGGLLEIAARNSSNGYYGGWIESENSKNNENYIMVSEDWTYTQ